MRALYIIWSAAFPGNGPEYPGIVKCVDFTSSYLMLF